MQSSFKRIRFHPSEVALAAIVLILFLVQALTTLAWLERLPLEDMAESVRSPYWWLNNTVFNGVSSAVTYYVLHVTAFNIFGYSIYLGKWLRLGLHLFSLISAAVLLRQWMGARLALVPLLIIGLSPTWLFFNTNQAQFGIDLQYAPIFLLIALKFPLQKKWLTYLSAFGLGMVFIWSALTYPTTLFYLPSVALLVAWRWWVLPGTRDWKSFFLIAFSTGIGLLVPIVACLLYVKNPQLLIFDPYHKSGLFRGGGYGLTRQPLAILEHYRIVLTDFFVRPNSYSLGIPLVEFNNLASQFGFFSVLLGSGWMGWRFWSTKKIHELIQSREAALLFWLAIGLMLIFNFPQLIATFPGIRRVTGVLVFYYGLLAYVWWALWTWPANRISKGMRIFLAVGVLLHLPAHLYTLQVSLQEGVVQAPLTKTPWMKVKPTLAESLEYWEKFSRDGNPLNCEQVDPTGCRYAEIYGAIQGYRYWSGMEAAPVMAWDPVSKTVRPLEIAIWETHERDF